MSLALRAPTRVTRRQLPAVAVASAALLTTGLFGLSPATADDPVAAAAAVGSACPAAFGVDDLVRATSTTPGTVVDGLTVSSGTEADAVTGEYVGTLEDGIAPGTDMLIFKMSGSVITDADGDVDRGIWAGMSGTPLYAPDGRLVGAVSYGLSYSPSDYAGVTPAEALYAADSEGGGAAVAALPRSVTSAMRTTGATTAEVTSGMRRLPLPISVPAALRPRAISDGVKKAGLRGVSVRAGGTGRTSTRSIPVTAGSNVAASMSYGSLPMVGVGTTTAVCGSTVFAFGHPMEWRGEAAYGLHGADAVYIEKDNFDGSFKVANAGAPLGTVTQDRLAAIVGTLGLMPETTPVRTVTKYGSRSRTSLTDVVTDDYLSYVAYLQALNDGWTVTDATFGGTAEVARTIVLERANGQRVVYRRSDLYADDFDVSGTPGDPLSGDIDSLLGGSGERGVHVVSASQTATIKKGYRAWRIGKVQVWQDGRWRATNGRTVVRARPGASVRVRVTLRRQQGAEGPASKVVTTSAKVPAGNVGGSVGTLTVYGGESGPFGEDDWDDWEEWEDFAASTYATVAAKRPRTLASLVKEMSQAEHGNDVVASLELGRGKKAVTRATKTRTSAVVSGAKSFSVVRVNRRR